MTRDEAEQMVYAGCSPTLSEWRALTAEERETLAGTAAEMRQEELMIIAAALRGRAEAQMIFDELRPYEDRCNETLLRAARRLARG